MSKDLSYIDFFAKDMDERWPRTMDELVENWILYQVQFDEDEDKANEELFWTYDAVSDLCYKEPDLALDFVLEVLKRDISNSVLEILAAGPMEDALARNGARLIDRVEAEARQNSKFQHLLGGVWQNATPNEVWQRVLKAAPERW